ncbi:MAG: pyridoxal phosphate-dependent aminotransferase [Clostridia bacterium]|nr:pyridoxal phosphate-dependent aminotransferase [Clostridia bacterium]
MNLSKKALQITPSVTLEISAKANEMKKNGKSVVSFGVGEPDFKTPEYIVRGCKEALDKGLTKYTPVAGTVDLKKAIQSKFLRDNGLKYDLDQIVVSTGAKSSLFHALFAILNEGDEVIIPKPFWLTYPEIVTICGAKAVYVETKAENGYKISDSELNAVITEKTKCLILNSPNNPSGSVYTRDELAAIAKVAVEKDIFVISDEVYEKLVFDGSHVSIASIGEEIKRRTIVINAVSKTYAMTGWRIGYLACEKTLAKLISGVQSHTTSNATSFAQYGAMIALNGGEETVNEMVQIFAERKELMVDLLNEVVGISYVKPCGAFYVFVDVSGYYGKSYEGNIITDSVSFAHAVLNEGVAVIPGKPFGNDSCIRLSYATSKDDISVGIDRIKNFLKKLS